MSTSSQPLPAEKTMSLRRLMALGFSTRLLVNTTVQLFTPFLNIFAAGLGVSVTTMGRMVSMQSSMGLLAPLFGTLADQFGYRRMMRLGLFLSGLGLLIIALAPVFPLVLLGMLILGIGLPVFGPLFQAYLSQQLPYTRRARVLGFIEYSWALAGIFGLFLVGQLIAWFGWQAPMLLLGGGFLLMALILQVLPARQSQTPAHPPKQGHWLGGLADFFRLPRNGRSTWAAITANGLNFFAMMHVLMIHSVWLSQDYGLGPAQLGTVALVGGCFDLGASALVSLVTDRLGKRRSVLIGLTGAMLSYALLPWFNLNVVLAVLSIVIPRFFFEFAVVSNIALLSEQVPSQRGKIMTLSVASGLIGFMLAGFSSPWAYLQFKLWGLGPVSAVSCGLSFGLVWLVVRDVED